MSASVEYIVRIAIPELGVRVNDVVVVQPDRIALVRKVAGQYDAWELPLTAMFILLQKQHCLQWYSGDNAPDLLFRNELRLLEPELTVSTNPDPKRQRGRPRTRRPALDVVR